MPPPVQDVLVIGASGLLGQALVREAEARGDRVTGTFSGEPVDRLQRLDLTDDDAIRRLIADVRPGVVALAAAMTHVDGCEAQPALAARVNAGAPGAVADACREAGARLVHVSTDYVFDGRAGPSDEAATPNPLSVYGRTKLEGERNVLAALPSALVVRTCANFGWNRLRAKSNSVTWILDRLRRGQETVLFTDQWVSPSYVPDVARVAFDLLERGASGVFHAASRDCLPRLGMGEAVCDAFGLDRGLLRPGSLADARLVAPRPARSCLAVGKLERTLHIQMPTFREALEDMRRSE